MAAVLQSALVFSAPESELALFTLVKRRDVFRHYRTSAIGQRKVLSSAYAGKYSCRTLWGADSACFQFGNTESFSMFRSSIRPSTVRVSVLSKPDVSRSEEESVEKRRQLVDEEIQNRPFKIQEIDTGGHQDWHPGVVMKVVDLAPGIRDIIVETECSRELVTLKNAYKAPGQLAQVKVGGGEVLKVPVSSPPFPKETNESVLLKIRGDIPAGTTKVAQFFLSVKGLLHLHVSKTDTPVLFGLKEGNELEVGPFEDCGLDLRPVMFLARFPTLLFFASGKGIAVAKAIIETNDANVGSLNLGLRSEVRLFYWSPNPSLQIYKDLFGEWEQKKVKVRTAIGRTLGERWSGHVGSFTTLWDEDDIEYDPETTGVVVCVDRTARSELKKLMTDAGIPDKQIVTWEV